MHGLRLPRHLEPGGDRGLHDRELLEGRETTEAAMRFIAITRALPQEQRDQTWKEVMRRARRKMWRSFPQELAGWLRQLVEYADDNGPPPDYWPVRPAG